MAVVVRRMSVLASMVLDLDVATESFPKQCNCIDDEEDTLGHHRQ